MGYLISLFVLCATFLSLTPIYSKTDESESGEFSRAYMELLARYPTERPGFGLDMVSDTPIDQAMTYGLVLSAESYRYQFEPTETGYHYVRSATNWLLSHELPGWGLGVAWDNFRDGSVTPASIPYTITTAIVLNGLLDAVSIPGFWSESETAETLDTATKTNLYFCQNAWQEVTVDGEIVGFFWYSPHPNDAYFVPNASAMLVGSLARHLYEHRSAIEPPDLAYLQRCLDRAAEGIVFSAQLKDNLPVWSFTVDWPGVPTRPARPNDLVHHAFIVYGMEMYRDFGGNRVELPWSRQQAVNSVAQFDSSVGLRMLPNHHEDADALPADLWGIGMTLAFNAIYAGDESAVTTIYNIRGNYGPWGNLQVYPVHSSIDATFYPRHAAFVLWGLAAYLFR